MENKYNIKTFFTVSVEFYEGVKLNTDFWMGICTPMSVYALTTHSMSQTIAASYEKEYMEALEELASVQKKVEEKRLALLNAMRGPPPSKGPSVRSASMYPFMLQGVLYNRIGYLDEDGDAIWQEDNDLWHTTHDETLAYGSYAGKLTNDLRLDNSPEVMKKEPDVGSNVIV